MSAPKPQSLSPLMRDTIEAMRAGTVYEKGYGGLLVVCLNASPSAPHPSRSTLDALERRGLITLLTPRLHGVPRSRWVLSEDCPETAPKPQQPQEVLDLMAALKESLRVRGSIPPEPEPESGSPVAPNCPLETGLRPCMCEGLPRCPVCNYTKHDAAFEGDHASCPGRIPDEEGEGGSPEAVEQAPRALEDFCWPADASPEQVTGGVMTSRQCEKLVQEAFPETVAQAAEDPQVAADTWTDQTLDEKALAGRILELRALRDELAERVRELEVCSDAVEILEEIEAGDPVFDDAKAFALAIVQKHRALEETNRELADALEAIRKQIAVTRDVPSDDLARYVDEWDDAVQRIDEICTETLGKAGRS